MLNHEKWLELEFVALRQEILTFGEAERSAVKFYLPAAATVYAVPYFLLQHSPASRNGTDAAVFVWTFCATVAGLLTFALANSLYWSVNGSRRIGMYIKECIETRTSGGLQWETVFYHLSQKRYRWPSDSAGIAAMAVLANLVAASAAAAMFLGGNDRFYPVTAASGFALLALPTIRRIVNAADARQEYSVRIGQIRDMLERKASLPAPVDISGGTAVG
jgi:hypothetical protein